jgi:hypothetical protein
VRLIGGYGGELSNNDERVQLQRPDDPPVNEPLNIPHVIEDEVLYDATAPWPNTSDGSTIQRLGSSLYGNAVASWTAASATPGTVNFTGGTTGDFDGNDVVDATDIDLLSAAIATGDDDPQFDLDGSATVDSADTTYLVENIIGTFMGDANLDGTVNAADLNAVGLNWQNPGGWAGGDFTGDGNVNAGDLNLIGINWQQGAVAAARAPRAPLAAGGVVDTAIAELDVRRELATSSSSESTLETVDHQSAAKRRDGLIQRRWARRPYRFQLVDEVTRSRQDSMDEAGMIDDVFAEL